MRRHTRSALLFILTVCLTQTTAWSAASQSRRLQTPAASLEPEITPLDESVFPENYPQFLKEAYLLLDQAEQLAQLPPANREAALSTHPQNQQDFFRAFLQDEELDIERLSAFIRTQLSPTTFTSFLDRFGIDLDNQEDIQLELLAQMERMRRIEAYSDFVDTFTALTTGPSLRIQLVSASIASRELEYALRHCPEEEFTTLHDIVTSKDGFGPQTSQDRDLLDYLEQNRRSTLAQGHPEASQKWRAVISQLLSQPVARTEGRLPFSKSELFAMMRNAERTLEQRKRPYIDVTPLTQLEEESEPDAYQIINSISTNSEPAPGQPVLAYAFLDPDLPAELRKLVQTYEEILLNKESGQTEATRRSVAEKKELLEILENADIRRVPELEATTAISSLLTRILDGSEQLYRRPFIRGIILFNGSEEHLAYRLIEEFPMIVAGETYPYQWKHDNEVNIALLLANVDPYQAAQAVRFIIYHYMWRSQEARNLGLYGWIPQIVFGDRQTGKPPEFNNEISYYFPDFPFRPTQRVDAEKERNRTSEIMQLPFFGWTVWRVYEELNKINEEHALTFLQEVYPYVRANTEAIRTALDPYDEAVLSGRDAWVNGMDNAWYHQLVMARHLPDRFIPEWAKQIVRDNRVDNRVDKEPGNPVDEELAKGRPSEYYYQFKVVFYDIINDLGLEPTAVYHASPYNAKDVALTGVMARSLEAQITLAEALQNTDADVHQISALRGSASEWVETWEEEINRYQAYLDQMKQVMNRSFWSPQDKTYYNRDVTQMFPGIVEQLFCRIRIDEGRIRYQPRLEYWTFEADPQGTGRYVLSQKALEAVSLDEGVASVSMDLSGNIQYEYKTMPQYWNRVQVEGGRETFQLQVNPGDPFIVEQFALVKKTASGGIEYEPNLEYWTWVEDESGGRYQLNERAKRLVGQGARKIEEGDWLRSPAIASFFPLFGHIPSEEQALDLSRQLVNPWMWWPENGIPIPTQPMLIPGPDGSYLSNNVYDPDKYWLGPTWMASNKPVIDGFHSYGYQMIYLYIAQRTVGTLQDGRAVEHWQAETGQVNTSNVNFPWSASGMAGSIWEELTPEEQAEYLRRFHPSRFPEQSTLNNNLNLVTDGWFAADSAIPLAA